MTTSIRPAAPADVPQILAFIRGLALYERASHEVTATEEGLLRDGFGLHPFYFCLIAEQNSEPAGFCLFFFNYSTWKGRPGVYVEDLYVEPQFRGLGIGKALLKQTAVFALEKGCGRMQWQVLDWNTPAIDFYRAMGAELVDEWRNVRIESEAMERLANAVERVKSVGAQG